MTRIEEERIDEKRPVFARPQPPHWNTDEGTHKANEYVSMSREELAMGDRSDFELANAQYLVSRHSISLLSFQTAAKERIRWLSAQLARADLELKELRAQGGVRVKGLQWTGPDVNGEMHARSILCVYTIRKKQGSLGYWLTEVGGYHSTVDKAKAAAFADYRTRILSALETESVAECATEGCERPATKRFEAGGVGSTYCGECFAKVIEIVAPPRSSIPTVTGWQPIETAPKDGSKILLWVDGEIWQARWNADRSVAHPWHSDGYSAFREDVPEYWMPRPSPRTLSEESKP